MSGGVTKLDTFPLWGSRRPCDCAGADLNDIPRLSPYLPAGGGSGGAVVVCPGGGYVCRADHEGRPVAEYLCGHGIAGIVLDYRVAPHRHPEPLSDAQRAIRTVRANAKAWGIDPDHVGILGFSAGGHLAASAATIFDGPKSDSSDPIDRHSSRPDALVACYAVLTFGPHRHDGSMRNLLGQDTDPRMQEYLSLENRVTGQTPPTFLWHTANDGAVPVENSLLFAQNLRRCNVPFSLHVFPAGRHGIGLAGDNPEASQWPQLCVTWLKAMRF